jgi:acyl-CoA synthetase (AMP-forming)/AMP-acid ligase II
MHHGLEAAAGRFPDHDALLFDESRWSYRELERSSEAFAQHLSDRGVQPGDRVAVMLTNRPEFASAVFGISKLGAAAVLINSAWKSLEVGAAVRLTKPRLGVADGQGAELLAGVLGIDRVLDLDADGGLVTFELQDEGGRPGVDVRDDDEALLVFSSGTTDQPKAVRHTHRTISCATRHWVLALGLSEQDRFQIATPPSHILGALNLLAAADAGATVRLHRRFDLDECLRRIETDKMTLEMAVAPIALAMANHPRLEDFDLSSLRYIMWGATPVTASVAEAVTTRTGVRWLPAYGASEVPVIAANPVNDPDAWRLDSVGLPVGDVELRVVDLDSNKVLEAGGIGEVEVRSASTMAGYLPDEATRAAFDDGWYRTGDVGWLEPDGWLHLTDRCKEMIKVNGFQVAPAELEAVLHGHPEVIDCAVFGIPDEQAGEVPIAAVKLEPGATVSAEDLQGLVADTLATYKRLRRVLIVEDIPRLGSGKVLRRTLRDEWADKISPTTKGA